MSKHMKTLLIITVFALLVITSQAQQSYVKYTYDASGNRTNREIIIPLQARYINPNNTDSVGAATDSSSLQASNEKSGSINEQQLQPVKETLLTGQTVTIFPNPTSGALAVEISNLQSSVATLQIIDVSGKQHYIKNKLAGREEINLSNAPTGTYFLRITLDRKMEEWKIIKQ